MQKEEWTDMGDILDLYIATKLSVWNATPFFFLLLKTSGNPEAMLLTFSEEGSLQAFFFFFVSPPQTLGNQI